MNKLEILIVDDSEAIRKLVTRIIQELDVSVTEAADGDAAFELIQHHVYDLIFMDINMPGLSGLDVIERVRNELGYRFTPIIVMTGLSSRDLIQQAFDAGASDYIAKPLSVFEVLARTRTQLDNRRMSRELSLANRSKSDFISRLTHELRDPLNAVIGLSDYIALISQDSRVKKTCATINEACRYQDSLISEAANLVKLEAGIIELHFEEVLFDELLIEIRKLIQPLIKENKLLLGFPRRQQCRYRIVTDRKRLTEILLNLLSNAIKYNKSRGSVDMLVDLAGDGHLRIAIRDTGSGIAEENLSKLFEPFNRLGAEKRNIKGMGFGLSLTKMLTELLGGELHVESRLGVGSTFCLDLKNTQTKRY
jgi:two-component system sensor histidine kinase/response regulator